MLSRRKFFKVVAAGVAAASVPAFLNQEKVQGKTIVEPKKPEFYGRQEQGFAVIDNRRILEAELDLPPAGIDENGNLLWGNLEDPKVQEMLAEALAEPLEYNIGLWNIKEGKDHNEQSLAEADKIICSSILIQTGKRNRNDDIFEPKKIIWGPTVHIPTYSKEEEEHWYELWKTYGDRDKVDQMMNLWRNQKGD